MNVWEVIIAISGAVQVIVMLAIYWGGEKRRDAKMQAAINERFALQAAENRIVTTELHAVVKGIKDRLESGDDKFDHQSEGLHKLELKMVAIFGTKEEMAAINERLSKIEIGFARLEAKHAGTRH